jgi:hypothetical protein
MNEKIIENLKDSLREIMKMIADRNEPLSEELKTMLVQVMEHVANRIQQLRQEEKNPVEGLTTPINTSELEPGAYPSSNINAFKYDYPSKKLLVKFQGKDIAKDGPIYSYEGIQPFIYDTFRKGAVPPKTSGKNKWHTWKKGVMPSLGAAMYHLIRNGGYPYQRVT